MGAFVRMARQRKTSVTAIGGFKVLSAACPAGKLN